METAISALIVIGVLILSVTGLFGQSVSSQMTIAEASRAALVAEGERARTNLAPVSATVSVSGDYLELAFRNSGSTRLSNFERWDLILRYKDTTGTNQLKWYGYPAQWSRTIYQVLSPPQLEAIEPGILNPGETLDLQLSLSPRIGTGSTNLATVSTPSGITATMVFTH